MAPALLEISLPKEYGYVLVTVAASFALSTWQGIYVGTFRKAAKVAYPNAYAAPSQIAAATSAEEKHAMFRFNCAQRAHGNFMEHYPAFLAGILLSGVRYPVTSAALGAVWVVSRAAYAVGYASGQAGGKGRYAGGLGMLWHLSALGYLGIVAKTGYDFVMA